MTLNLDELANLSGLLQPFIPICRANLVHLPSVALFWKQLTELALPGLNVELLVVRALLYIVKFFISFIYCKLSSRKTVLSNTMFRDILDFPVTGTS